MQREEWVTVQGPVKEQQPDGMSHRGCRGHPRGRPGPPMRDPRIMAVKQCWTADSPTAEVPRAEGKHRRKSTADDRLEPANEAVACQSLVDQRVEEPSGPEEGGFLPRASLFLVARTPSPRGGVPACLFGNSGCPQRKHPPPPLGWPLGRTWPKAKAFAFLCVDSTQRSETG